MDKGHGEPFILKMLGRPKRFVPGSHHDEGMDAFFDPSFEILDEKIPAAVIRRRSAHLDGKSGIGLIKGLGKGAHNKEMTLLGALQQFLFRKQLILEFPVVKIGFLGFLKKRGSFIKDKKLVRRYVIKQAGFRFLFARSNGHDINLCEAADAALVLQGKTADGVDGFIKPFNPDRILGINGKNVKDVTANGKLAQGFDLIRAFISLFN